MTALGAPADLGASRCPSDPAGTSHLSRAATGPTPEYLEGRTLPVQRSLRTLALARAARAGTHPGLSPSTHMFSYTHSLESTRLCDGMGTWLRSHRFGTRLRSRQYLAPFGRITPPPAPTLLTSTHPAGTRCTVSHSFPSHPNTHPHPFTLSCTHKVFP